MILAIPAALAAMPENPNMPATMAIIRKITVQRNIGYHLNVNKIGVPGGRFHKSCQRYYVLKHDFLSLAAVYAPGFTFD